MRIEDRFTVSLPVEEAWKVLLDVERIAPCMPGAQLQEITDEEYRGIVKVKLGAINAQYKGAVRITEADEGSRRIVLDARGRETRGQGNASAQVVATLVDLGGGITEVAIETDLTITGRIAQFGRGVMADVSTKLLGDFARCLEEDLIGQTGRDPGARAGEAGGGSGSPAPSGSDDGGGGAGPAESEALVESGDEAVMAGPAGDAGEASQPVPTQPEPTQPAPTQPEPTQPEPGRARPAVRLVSSTREPEPLDLLAVAGPSVFQRLIPAAVVGVLVTLVVVKGRARRGLLSAAGAGLVAAQVALSRRS